jgi:hypothetical protein
MLQEKILSLVEWLQLEPHELSQVSFTVSQHQFCAQAMLQHSPACDVNKPHSSRVRQSKLCFQTCDVHRA